MRRTSPLLALVILVLVAAGCGGSGASGPPKALLEPAKLTKKAPQLYDVTFHTTKGDFVVSVHRTWAPKAADRFYNLVKNHFYDGQRIFRVVPKFVVQFGISNFPAVAEAWQEARIPDDTITVQHQRGAVAFASAGPGSRTTQIFIDLANNSQLNLDVYAPFAAVSQGMHVVDSLYSGYGDEPTPHQQEMSEQGDAYFDEAWPKLDEIKSTTVSNEESPALP